MKGSVLIVIFFLIGVFLGYVHVVPATFEVDDYTFYALCVLLFVVGYSIGSDVGIITKFKQLNPGYALLPLMTFLGTIGGSLVVSLILPQRSAPDCMAVGSGFAYYSLSSIFITQYKGVELGTIALISNILRELLTLLLAPLLVRFFDKLAPIAAGGATTADTTLPIISKTCGRELIPLSIYHGFLIDFSVPFVVTFFCSL
ncbi:lysine exporter LysO family protein [Phocaeicola oris]|uniref:lysine exporter LysO family protein n=1 Tax=Phocaeicola oris TaxID=2896850 RepID=UPI00234F82CB|nr:lysine exporter LysO family protein [Phocaeicola oris]MCE2617513.1 lysine exporter LysO family protein [Phocaeicola oris]